MASVSVLNEVSSSHTNGPAIAMDAAIRNVCAPIDPRRLRIVHPPLLQAELEPGQRHGDQQHTKAIAAA